jgi:hypothetical protein
MSELFEPEEIIDVLDTLQSVDKPPIKASLSNLGARRRLENMLEEKRLRDELDDFLDY